MYPPPVEKLISSFSRFPTIGRRTATRFALYLLTANPTEIAMLIENLKEIRDSVALCDVCFRSTLASEKICSICSSSKRDQSTLCVIEKESDLIPIEKTSEYNGLYFILGGNISPLKKEDLRKIRGSELKQRLMSPESFNLKPCKEVIIATNQTPEGEATAVYIERLIKELNIKTTKLGRGLSTGSELEYADEETILSALKRRN